MADDDFDAPTIMYLNALPINSTEGQIKTEGFNNSAINKMLKACNNVQTHEACVAVVLEEINNLYLFDGVVGMVRITTGEKKTNILVLGNSINENHRDDLFRNIVDDAENIVMLPNTKRRGDNGTGSIVTMDSIKTLAGLDKKVLVINLRNQGHVSVDIQGTNIQLIHTLPDSITLNKFSNGEEG